MPSGDIISCLKLTLQVHFSFAVDILLPAWYSKNTDRLLSCSFASLPSECRVKCITICLQPSCAPINPLLE